jgi:16S rRNA (adenine1518-N6/adenine1519-N6)-dimethyltransferase
MEIQSPKKIKELLAKYGASPLKGLGQNFLINPGVLQKIIDAADLKKEEMVMEIGPGLGALTRELAPRAKKVLAIEKDRKYAAILKATLNEYKNVKIIHEDILKFDIEALESDWKLEFGNWKLIANLPYNITSPVIRKFLECANQPKEMVLMVQKEVASRICAGPPEMSLLAVSVRFYGEPKIMSFVSKGSFWPAPNVGSAILKIKTTKKAEASEPELFFKIVKAGFSAPRKQLAGNLAKGLDIPREIIEGHLKKANIAPNRRAETVSLEEWTRLADLF